jgi:NADP-dependent 3-hydroxy acid dehydrogenase YdfG
MARGDRVIATARSLDSLTHLPASDDLHLLQLDVTEKEASIKAKIKTAIAVWGRIDVLVNNAGFGRSAFIEEGGYVHNYPTSRAILMTNGDIGQS